MEKRDDVEEVGWSGGEEMKGRRRDREKEEGWKGRDEMKGMKRNDGE